MIYLVAAFLAWVAWTTAKGYLRLHPEVAQQIRSHVWGLATLVLAAFLTVRGHVDLGIVLGLLALASFSDRDLLHNLKDNVNSWLSGGGAANDPRADARREGAPRRNLDPSAMTEEEAYQLLGLAKGASAEEIARAHRTLMKKAHPDRGGTTYWAARLNQARQVLMDRHR